MRADKQEPINFAESRAAQVFIERNKAFRIIFDTVINIAGASDDAVFPLLCTNLRNLCNAEYVELATCDAKNQRITIKAIDCAQEQDCQNVSGIIGRNTCVTACVWDEFRQEAFMQCQQPFSLGSLVTGQEHKAYKSGDGAQSFHISCKSSEGALILLGTIRLAPRNDLKMRDLVLVYINMMEQIMQRISAVEALREKEQRYALIIEGANLGTWDWNVQTGDLVLNERWAEMLGYSLDEIKPNIASWEGLVHPSDLPRVYVLLEKHLEGRSESFEDEFRMKAKSGEWRWILSRGRVLEKDDQGRSYRAAGTYLDITNLKQAEAGIMAHAEKEKELASCSRELLSSDNLDQAITRALQHLLNASDASRAYVFENIRDDRGSLCMSRTHEVCRSGVVAQIDNPALQCVPYKPEFGRWMNVLSTGGLIRGLVDDFPESEQAILKKQDIASLIVLPIQVEKQWYGFLGFDACGIPKTRADSDIYLLRTGSEMIGNYLERNRAAQRILQEKEKAEEVTRELAELVDELKRFNRLAVGREMKMIELKREINTLNEALGREAPYALAYAGPEKEQKGK